MFVRPWEEEIILADQATLRGKGWRTTEGETRRRKINRKEKKRRGEDGNILKKKKKEERQKDEVGK